MEFDHERAARRRRPFEEMEVRAIRLFLDTGDEDARPLLDTLRYALNFAKLIAVDSGAGAVEVDGPLAAHAAEVRELIAPRLRDASAIWELARAMPQVVQRTRQSRAALLDHLPIDRDALEAEVTTKQLAIASGGGGGAGYVYPGSYEVVERLGIVPAVMVGTSIGSLMSLFRARRRMWDFAPLVGAARELSWSNTFSVLQTANRYGLPATLRLYLRRAIGRYFLREDGEPMRLSDMEIPLLVMATGIRVDALKHDLDYYEHLMDETFSRRGVRTGVRGGIKAVTALRELMATPEALKPVVLGWDEGTGEFDALDAAGFSAAIPGVIHYDVLRDDPRMHRVLDQLYARLGVTRLGEGGMVSNVPARAAWRAVTSGRYGVRNAFVLALDCFAPNPRRIAWLPMQQAVRTANVESDRRYADAYVTYPRTLSPMNLVPRTRDALTAVRWGREAMEPVKALVAEAMRPIPVLAENGDATPA